MSSSSENDSFADIPFEQYRRKKPNQDQWIVRTAMKAVLLSPVIVLVVWSLAAFVFAHHHRQQQQPSNNNSNSNSSTTRQKASTQRGHWWSRNRNNSNQQQPQVMMFPSQGNPGMIVQPQFLPAQLLSPQQQPYYLTMQDPRYLLPQQQGLMGAAQQYYTLPEQQGQVPQVAQPMDLAGEPPPLAGEAQPQFYVQQPQPLPQLGAAQQYYTFPEEGQPQSLPKVGVQPLQGLSQQEQFDTLTAEAPPDPIGQQLPALTAESPPDPIGQQLPVLPQPILQRAQPHHSNLRHGEKVQYYFYDPRTTVQDEQGNIIYLPQTVYDAYGRPVSLQSLSASVREIQIEPPSTMTHYNISANTTLLNFTYSHPTTVQTPVKDNKKEMSLPTGANMSSAWGSSTAGDSSLIVATVGVMALLVGALSARRMRARSILAACIENESLEDDAAYDAAYTVGGAHHYNTFQQGWKGDLEKFDV